MPEPAGSRSRELLVERAGALLLVQDLGRPGSAHLGVPRSGALDLPAHCLAQRLVGNPENAAGLESLGGGVRVRVTSATTVAVTGARVPVTVDGRAVDWGNAVSVAAGAVVALGAPTAGLRAHLALAGGVRVTPELGSRSSDLLSGLGPAPLVDGDRVPLGASYGEPRPVDTGGPRGSADRLLRIVWGPREDWFTADSRKRLLAASYVVGSDSNRVGLRLEGDPLERSRRDELPSEGVVLGAVQVPPSGQPVVFLADHPTTGGYPVVGVVDAAAVARCAQLRPGDRVGFTLARSPSGGASGAARGRRP